MAWLRISFDVARADADPLTRLLEEHGAEAVTLEEAGAAPVLEPAPGQTPLWDLTRVVGLWPGSESPEPLLDALKRDHPHLPPHRLERLEDQAWERAWMERFEPMRFGRRLWVVPTWHQPPDPAAANLRLDPGLAFGTGTHPTTALCLEWLDGAPLEGCRVLDYGCGSGILAVAAALLGAREVAAVDIDPQALTATAENARRNGVAERVAVSAPGDLGPGPFDVVLANILAGPLVDLAPPLARLTAPGGRIALSGILAADAPAVEAAYQGSFALEPHREHEGWVLVEGRRPARGE